MGGVRAGAEIIAGDVYYVLALTSQAWARGFACVLTCSPHSTLVGMDKVGFGEHEGLLSPPGSQAPLIPEPSHPTLASA